LTKTPEKYGGQITSDNLGGEAPDLQKMFSFQKFCLPKGKALVGRKGVKKAVNNKKKLKI